MSALTATWTPSSLQLRFAFNCRNPSTFVRMRVAKVERRVCSFLHSAVNGDGRELRGREKLWVKSKSSTNDFSGWAGADDVEKPSQSQGKQSIGGIVGAGVAGIILVAGITYAALSISKQSTSNAKQSMNPLTTQQEMSLSLNDQNDTILQEKDIGKDVVSESGGDEMNKGIHKEYLSYEENDEPNESRLNGDTNMGHSSSSNDLINDASLEQYFHHNSAISNISGGPEATDKPTEFAATDNSFLSTTLENKGISQVAVLPEPTADIGKDIPLYDEPTESPLADSAVISSDTNQQGGASEIKGSEHLDSPLDSSGIEPSSDDLPVNLRFGAVSVMNVTPEWDAETAEYLSAENAHLDEVIASSGSDESPFEVGDLKVAVTTETTSLSGISSLSLEEQIQSDSNDLNVQSRSSIDLTNTEGFFTSAGIPAPCVVSATVQVPRGKVLVPATVDQVQGQALAALQVLKVIEADVQPGELCTRREYARWLVSASSALSRNTGSKVYPAMFIENITELAFDDIIAEDPDFPSIQGLAEAGLISSKLSRRDMQLSLDSETGPLCFSPESPVSRQDLVSWKMALEKRQLPVVNRKIMEQKSGFIDIDRIDPDAWPAIVADLAAGEQGIVALAFGYTRLFQPEKPVTKAQAAIALATGEASDIVSEELARIEAESMAEKAVAVHNALIAQVEKDVNSNFEKELLLEREKIDAVEKLAEDAKRELERLRAEREEENLALVKERAAVDSEMEVLSRLRREVEEQLQKVLSDKLEISYERERVNKLRRDAETESKEITRLQYELEVERKALTLARAWAEDEAKRAQEQAKALDVARERWERQGIKVVVDDDLREEANVGVTWLNAGKQFSVEGTVDRAESIVDKLKAMADTLRGKSKEIIDKIVQTILSLISILKEQTLNISRRAEVLTDAAKSKMQSSWHEAEQSLSGLRSAVADGAKRVADDCRDGVEKISQKFKT